MTKPEFLKGLKVYWSSGGATTDAETIEVWFQIVQGIPLIAYQFAIKGIIEEVDNLALINFVKQVKDRAKMFAGKNRGQEWKKQHPAYTHPEEWAKRVKENNDT